MQLIDENVMLGRKSGLNLRSFYMLIEFSVSNFRSFRERQTFSMVAAPRLGKSQNKFKPDLKGEKFPQLLKVAAIYGPNASGKSGFISALGIVRQIINVPANQRKSIPATPFKFDQKLTNKPSAFEYHFIQEGVRYQFILETTHNRIHQETLIYYPKGQEKLLYSRTFDGTSESYEIGDDLEGGRIVHDAWKKLTSPQTLFLAQAVANSSDELQQLKHPYKWFTSSTSVIHSETLGRWSQMTRAFGLENEDLFKGIAEFLQEIDVPVTNINFEKREDHELSDSEIQEFEGDEFIGNIINADKKIKTTLTHSSALGEADFDFSEESGGTKNLIGFWLPWVVLGKGTNYLLAIDELDSSLHPKIVEALVEQHIASNFNSQLIFTTHDTHLMNTRLLRRDQFWLTERDKNGATRMFAIHDFVGRESEDVEKRYFEGRYRGLPIIRKSH